mgnify:FL=1
MNTGRLAGKAFLVTGGASGIGHATAILFAREGARIGVLDVDADQGAAMVETLRSQGNDALFLPTDVSRSDAVHAAVQQSLAHFGSLPHAA